MDKESTMNNYGTVVLPLDIKCKIYVGIENRIYIQ